MPKVQRATAFEQIADAIQHRIESGDLAPGDKTPSARQIVADWDVSITTATRVLAELRARGLAWSAPGVGTVVRGGSANTGDQEPETVQLVPAPAEVAAVLGVPAGAQVERRDRITKNGGRVAEYAVVWAPR